MNDRKRKERTGAADQRMSHPAPDELLEVDSVGHVQLPGVLNPQELRAVTAAMADSDPRGNCDIADVRLGCLWHHPRVLGLVEHVLGSGFRLDGFYGRVSTSPEVGGLHRDTEGSVLELGSYRCLVIFPLDPFRENNGATRVIRGSHALAGDEWEDPHPDEVPLLGRPGDAFVMNAAVVHRVGANTSGSSRRSIFVSYMSRDSLLSDGHNQAFVVTEEFLGQLTDGARNLLARGRQK